MERTLIILKPDAVQRALVGELITRLERRGLRISGLKLIHVTEALAGEHYREHVGKGFFPGLVAYITSAPVVVMAVDGPGAIALVRTTVGVTKPAEAAPGTIRADYGVDIGRNLIHASANAADAERELALWFGAGEIIAYRRDVDRWIVEG